MRRGWKRRYWRNLVIPVMGEFVPEPEVEPECVVVEPPPKPKKQGGHGKRIRAMIKAIRLENMRFLDKLERGEV